MTETFALPDNELDSPLALLLDIVATTTRRTREEEREGAETAAADHVYRAYTSTLGAALEDTQWTGYPALGGTEPSAVAYLGAGLWLHHTTTYDTEYSDGGDALALIVPCACGRGYITSHLESEDDLVELLAELHPTGGRAEHGSDTRGRYCASIPARAITP
ncbi:hypothetical protein [Streptomyces youssoufiensis]